MSNPKIYYKEKRGRKWKEIRGDLDIKQMLYFADKGCQYLITSKSNPNS